MVRRTGSVWMALGLLPICVAAVRGQSEGDIIKAITRYANPPGLAAGTPAGSYALGDAESIDYFSGHLNYELPLVQVGGRGEAGYTVSLKIPSRWEASSVVNCHPISEGYHCDPTKFSAEFDSPQAAAVGYGPGLVRKRTNGTFGLCYNYRENPIPEIYGMTSSRSTLVFIDSHGTEHELFDKSQFDGQYHAPAANGCVASEYPPSRGRIFASRDGSAMSFVADGDILDDQRLGMANLYPANGGRLYFPNGVMYRVDTGGRVQYIRDRFGNITTFEYGGVYGKLVKVTDPEGRETLITYSPELDTISYPAANGGRNTIEIGYSGLANRLRADLQSTGIRTYHELFSSVNDSCAEHVPPSPRETCLVNPWLPAYVTLPNGRQYQFRYNLYGELAEVGLPTGGRFEYDWAGGEAGTQSDGYYASGATDLALIHRVVKQRRAYTVASGGTAAETTYFEPGAPGSGVSRQVFASSLSPNAPRLEWHTYNGSPVTSSFLQPGYEPYWDHGKETRTEIKGGGATLKTVENEWVQLSNWTPVLKSVTTKLKRTDASTIWSKTEYSYDLFANITQTTETDWGAGTVGAVLRKQSTTYVTDTAYTHANETNPANYKVHLRRLPLSAATYKVVNGVDTQEARTEFVYDESTYPESNCAGLARHDTNLPPSPFDGTQYRADNPAWRDTSFVRFGNVTTMRSWVSGSAYISAHAKYDLAGNPVWTKDGRAHETTLTYGQGNCSLLSAVSTVVDGSSHVVSMQYDLNTGKITQHTDPAGVNTSLVYEPTLGRLSQVINGLGSSFAKTSTIAYNDNANTVTVTAPVADAEAPRIPGAINAVNISKYDGLGRVTETEQATGGNPVIVKTSYDTLGQVASTSLPSDDGNYQYVTFAYDALGRRTKATNADGSAVRTCYAGDLAISRDEAGKWRQARSDALGRLVEVIEDPASVTCDSETNSGSGLSYKTKYSYNALDNLLTVSHMVGDSAAQVRTFTYDGLGRLLTANNPESGTISYVYDANGNLTQKTDARGVVASFTYDGLNRPLTKSYTSGVSTPAVAWVWDTVQKGKLTWVGSGISKTTFSYDVVGRIAASVQRTDNIDFEFQYQYHKGWGLRQVTYPSGRQIYYAPDAAERTAKVLQAGSGGNPDRNYWTGAQYAPQGALKQVTLGNGLIERWQYNLTRQQPYDVRLGTAGNEMSHLTLQFAYCANQYSGGSCATNNGNIIAQFNYANNHIEHYGYDALNRLSSATDYTVAPNGWSQSYGYDRFGNRWVPANGTLPMDPRTPTSSSYINPANNRLTGTNYGYDAAGNQTAYGGWTLAYDAENRLVGSQSSGGSPTTYAYDGEGRRVKKTTDATSTVYVYGADGELAAEYGGPAQTTGTRYITTDHLGSTRLVTDASGNVVSRHDYLPFGEEIPAGIGGRTAAMKYVANTALTQRFTGKERDTETGLDYFGARYLSGVLGRWTSVDPYSPMMVAQLSIAGGLPAEAARSHMQDFLDNPQNWNRYAYVRNNPLALVDPFGEAPVPAGHHLIPNRVNLGPIGTEFANAIRTGPLANNYPNQPGFNTLHRAYNGAAEGILRQFESRFGASRSAWTASQWRQAANGILNSQLPAIRNFLDLLNKNNAGKVIPALTAAIDSYTPSAALLARLAASSLLRLLKLPIVIFFDPRIVTGTERRDPESDRLPAHERCLKSRDGTCVI